MGRHAGTIGQGVVIKGEVSSTEDLTIEGRVEGKVKLDRNVLTIGRNGRVEAQVRAKVVNVMGTVDGDIRATETINVCATAEVDGALAAPRIGIEEGASFRGQVDIVVSIPLESAVRRLKPEKRHMRFLRRLVGNSILGMRPEAELCRLFGVSPKLVETTMTFQVEGDSRRGPVDRPPSH